MRKISAVLSLIVSIALIATGVMVAWLEPLTNLLPNSEFATAAVTSTTTDNDASATESYQVPEDILSPDALPVFETSSAMSIESSTSSAATSKEYLFSYSFGADFYTEIYSASYKIFNQLLNISSTLDSVSTAVATNYKAQVATLRAVEGAEKTLTNIGLVLNDQYKLQSETLSALETVSTQISELAASPVASSLTGIHSALVVIIRLLGVMIGFAGLAMLCKALQKLGDAFGKKPVSNVPAEASK